MHGTVAIRTCCRSVQNRPMHRFDPTCHNWPDLWSTLASKAPTSAPNLALRSHSLAPTSTHLEQLRPKLRSIDGFKMRDTAGPIRNPQNGRFHQYFQTLDGASFAAMLPIFCLCLAQLGVKLPSKDPKLRHFDGFDVHVRHMASIGAHWAPSPQHNLLAPTGA